MMVQVHMAPFNFPENFSNNNFLSRFTLSNTINSSFISNVSPSSSSSSRFFLFLKYGIVCSTILICGLAIFFFFPSYLSSILSFSTSISSGTTTFFFPNWAIEFKTMTDIETLAIGIAVAYPTALFLIGIALWAVLIGIISITTPVGHQPRSARQAQKNSSASVSSL